MPGQHGIAAFYLCLEGGEREAERLAESAAAWALGACPSKEGSPVIRILAVTLPSGGASGNHPAGVIPARTTSRAARSACPREAPRFVRPNKNGDFAVGNSRSATGHRFM